LVAIPVAFMFTRRAKTLEVVEGIEQRDVDGSLDLAHAE
jgi:hypothetical protein